MQKKSWIQRTIRKFYNRALQMLFMGIVTGFLAGVAVSFYNILVSIGEGVSTDFYAYIRTHWQLIPLLFILLTAGAFLVGTAVKLIPLLRGSGIPQVEGIAQGKLRYKNWFATLCGIFASSLACIFLGLSAGGEGPSIQIGGCLGYGSAPLLTKTDMIRRYQITGGACAGLAVAFNAPLTGMVFAFEEAHKRFSPDVFICAFSSVITAVFTRNIIRNWLGYSTGAVLEEYSFISALPLQDYGFVLLTALACALLGVLFYHMVLGLKEMIDTKVTFAKNTGKMIFPFLLGGAFGLLTKYAMGGGHSLLEALGRLDVSGGQEIETILSLSVWATLGVVLCLKLITSVVNMACGVPCGVFIPMLTIGATLGALTSGLFVHYFKMDPSQYDLFIIIGMSAFFTCVVRAPLTGIIMAVELTWDFTALLPIVIGVSIGYMVGEVLHTKPIYEVLLEKMLKIYNPVSQMERIELTLVVQKGSKVVDMELKDLLLPAGTVIKKVVDKEGKTPSPTGDLALRRGDTVLFSCTTSDKQFVERELRLLCGEDAQVLQT